MTPPTAWADLAWLTALAALTAYLLLGGADFGGGVWDLLATGEDAQAQRRAVAEAMGPVWEANHVWLIFLLILLFTAFPPFFHALVTDLYVPLNLILLGIILRGAAFVFRSRAPAGVGPRSTWGAVFGAASTLALLLLGAAVGAVTKGGPLGVPQRSWLSPLALATGLFAVAAAAYLSAVYLTLETRGTLQATFRRRARWAALALALAGSLELALLHAEALRFWSRLASPGILGVALLTVALGAASYACLTAHRDALARGLGAAAVGLLLWGWAAAQWPYIAYPGFPVRAAAAPSLPLRETLLVAVLGLVVLVPSLWLLFHVFKGGAPRRTPRPSR